MKAQVKTAPTESAPFPFIPGNDVSHVSEPCVFDRCQLFQDHRRAIAKGSMEADIAAPKLLSMRTSPFVILFALVERGLHHIGSLLPEKVKRRLCPELDEDEEAGEEGCSDLLSVSQRRIRTDLGRDVVLSIECVACHCLFFFTDLSS